MKYGNVSAARGFTLIELMIVVVVIAVLAAIAVPNYTQYVQRGYRAQAMASLLQDANWMQQQFTINNTYPATTAVLPQNGSPKYSITVNASTASSFTLWATPVTNDKCGTFTLDNTGLRSTQSGTTPAAASADCWAGR
ncbi:type IV pilin protein [Collimonas pratensis]|uniref:Prepilin-type N-terminal cleavage/methylation domain protein n=1 Tax=Collimonas pratensis TaxID=279113 RepID=A0ABM5ZBJ3_9BURK|nr:type IV pilin protein [Collimonas pratensis]AMP16571.1 prepilin-type N-terminal cleavage/methylation domain protein [Collimonas pratensis]